MGVGGGVIMVPLMVTLLPFTQHQAHGTSLAVLVFTAMVSVVTYGGQGNVDPVTALELAVGGIVGARIGALWVNHIPAAQLRRIFGGFIFLVGLRMVLPSPPALAWLADLGFLTVLVNVFIGTIIGVLSGMLGVGGGIILVPALVLLLGIEQHLAQGISLLYIVPTSIVGAFTHYRKGNVLVSAVPWMVVGSIATAVVGSSLAAILPAALLRQVFGAFLSLVGLQMGLTKATSRQMASAKQGTEDGLIGSDRLSR
jgi:hypothetical protein